MKIEFLRSSRHIVFVMFCFLAILYAGTKPSKSPVHDQQEVLEEEYQEAQEQSRDIFDQPGQRGRNDGPPVVPKRSIANNSSPASRDVSITDFAISPETRTLTFAARWWSLYGFSDPKAIYLFASTNLLENKWTPLAAYDMPRTTNTCVLTLSDDTVDPSVQPYFRETFKGKGFYCFGDNYDCDDDGLPDCIEKFWTMTDPNEPDTDGDGLTDGEELSTEINANPLVADTDGDGILDGDEIVYGTNPRKANSDSDDFTDLQEIGKIEELNKYMWISGSSDSTNLLARYTTADDECWTIPLAGHLTINNVTYTNALVSLNGVVHLLCPTNQTGWRLTDYNYDGGLSNTQWSAAHTTIALLNANLYARNQGWSTRLTHWSGMYNGKLYDVITYYHIGLYECREDDNENTTTLQLILPASETNTIYMSYQIGSSIFREAHPTIGIQCGGIPSIRPNEQFYNLTYPIPSNFLRKARTIKYTIGTGTDPTRADTDCDGLSDSDEIFVYHTNPHVADSDGDGLNDGDEIARETNPWSADSDGDGLPDKWEVENDLNPILDDSAEDPDGDGLTNLEEFKVKTNPQLADSDGDGLNDRTEVGYWEFDYLFPSLSSSSLQSILDSTRNYDNDSINYVLPFPVYCAGYCHTNVTICIDGIVALATRNARSIFWASTDNQKIGQSTLSSDFTVIAPYWDDLYIPANSNADILTGEVQKNGNQFAVIEYRNMRLYSSRNDSSAIGTFQVIFPQAETNKVYVRYCFLSSSFQGQSASIGAQLPKNERAFDVSFNETGNIQGYHTIVYHLGAGSDPNNVDSDNDGLTDAQEFSLGTSSRYSDTDNDGLPDVWEWENGLNASSAAGNDGALGDPDGDLLTNELEYRYGTNPRNRDTDGDGLTDGRETGYIFPRRTLPWLNFQTAEELTVSLTNTYKRCVSRPLPHSVTIQSKTVTNITISANGLLFLDKAGYRNNEWGRSSHQFDRVLDSNTLVIAPYLNYAYFRTDIPGKESFVKYGTSTWFGYNFLVIEYANMYDSSSPYQTNSISFQVAINLDLPECAFVTYKDLMGRNVTGENANIGLQSFDGIWLHSYCNRQAGKIWEDLQLEFDFSTNTHPLKSDTDGDGLTDAYEVNVTHTNPQKMDEDDDGLTDAEEIALGTNPSVADTDGDGLLDGWEIEHGLNPRSSAGDDGADGDPDHDGLTNCEEQAVGGDPRSSDTDGDGLSDSDELRYGTSVFKADTDGDGIDDRSEIRVGLNPCEPDTDGDGLYDGWEARHGMNPSVNNQTDDDPSNDSDADPDGDGLPNGQECDLGTNPYNSDTDGDGVSDGVEVRQCSDPNDPSDGGIQNSRASVSVIFGDPSGSHSEKYRVKVTPIHREGQNPLPRAYDIVNANYGECEVKQLFLARGVDYRVELLHAGTNINGSPDYDYEFEIFDDEFNGVIVDDPDGLQTPFDGSSSYFSGDGKIITLHVLGSPKLVPDYNRDGVIDSQDEALAAQRKILRFWVNDDADNLAIDGKYADTPKADIPGAGSSVMGVLGRDADALDEKVNGWSDLLDFTPVSIDLSVYQHLPESIRENLTYKLVQDDGAVNVVWTGLSKSSVGEFQKDDVNSCGRNLDENAYEAKTECVDASGLDVPEKLAKEMKSESSNKGVFFIEGRQPSQSPLKLEVYYLGQQVATTELRLNLSSVEDMYWFYSIRGAERSDNYILPSSYTPSNLSEDVNAKTVFFTHGFNVDANAARAWGCEVFKRLWQSGSNAKFKMVTWPGDYHVATSLGNGLYYHQDVYQALRSGNAYKRLVEREESVSDNRVLMAQSLGNMLTCEALRQGLTTGNYFMFNAAVASEALDGSLQASADVLTKYVPEDWNGYPHLSWTANWYKWFENDTSDPRGKMGWPNYFESILSRCGSVHNYYSTGDPVFMESQSAPSLLTELFHLPDFDWSWPFIHANITAEAHAWQKQETLKGVNPIAGTLTGGWGFNSWTVGFHGNQYMTHYSASEANDMVQSGAITNHPVFNYKGTEMLNRNARQTDIWRTLAKHVPAVSSPMGKTDVGDVVKGNYNLNSDLFRRNAWGRTYVIYGKNWLHSDMKDMAFFYVYKLYNDISQKGSLK